jgi:hypothetical protein
MREEEESCKETDFCELLGVVFSQGWTALVLDSCWWEADSSSVLQNVDFVRVGRTDAIHPELWGHVINGPGSLFLSPEVPKTWEEAPFFSWVFLYLFSSLFDHISLQHRRYPRDQILIFFPQ